MIKAILHGVSLDGVSLGIRVNSGFGEIAIETLNRYSCGIKCYEIINSVSGAKKLIRDEKPVQL